MAYRPPGFGCRLYGAGPDDTGRVLLAAMSVWATRQGISVRCGGTAISLNNGRDFGRLHLSRSQRHDACLSRGDRGHARLLERALPEPGQPARIRSTGPTRA